MDGIIEGVFHLGKWRDGYSRVGGWGVSKVGVWFGWGDRVRGERMLDGFG